MSHSSDEGVVTKILGTIESFSDKVTASDTLLLTSDERSSPHMVAETEGGRTFRISMPRGSELNDGDVLALVGDLAIVVIAAPENLFLVTPKDTLEWGVAGYHLGNLHRPVRFSREMMLTPADPMVGDMLDKLGISYDRRMTPFVGFRYGSHVGHHHHDANHHAHGNNTYSDQGHSHDQQSS